MSRLWETGPRLPTDEGRYIPKAVRDFVMQRDEGICQYCGAQDNNLDHVYPWANGGTHHPANLVVSCNTCNSIAGLRVFTEFAKKKAYILARRIEIATGVPYE